MLPHAPILITVCYIVTYTLCFAFHIYIISHSVTVLENLSDNFCRFSFTSHVFSSFYGRFLMKCKKMSQTAPVWELRSHRQCVFLLNTNIKHNLVNGFMVAWDVTSHARSQHLCTVVMVVLVFILNTLCDLTNDSRRNVPITIKMNYIA